MPYFREMNIHLRYSFFRTFTIATRLMISIQLPSCRQSPKTPDHLKVTIDKTTPEYASAYICPMHCKGSGSEAEGICPVCKMDCVKNKDYVEQEEVIHIQADPENNGLESDTSDLNGEETPEESFDTEEGQYQCPHHPDVIGEAGDQCSICGMELILMSFEDTDVM